MFYFVFCCLLCVLCLLLFTIYFVYCSIPEYTMEHWREDWFFGYQFLNGSNPRMITQIQELPSNFCVSGDMVQAFLKPNTSLEREMKVLAFLI